MLVFSGSSRVERKDTEYLTENDLKDLHRALEQKFEKNVGEGDPVVSDFGLRNAVDRPGSTVMGRDAFPTFPEKAAALFLAIVKNSPFRNSNQRLAVAALWAFCALNDRKVNTRYLGDKTLRSLISAIEKGKKKPEEIWAEIRTTVDSAIEPV